MSIGRTLLLTSQAEQPAISTAPWLGSLICEYFVLSFALWTIATNITAFAGGTLRQLLVLGGVLVLPLLAWRWIRKRQQGQGYSERDHQPGELDNRAERLQRVLLWLLVIAVVVLTMIAHRPDEDDDRYVNRAIAVLDDPALPILRYDTRHSVLLPMDPATSKVASIDMLAAALSWFTGVPPIYFFHLLFPPLAAMLCLAAYAELFKLLAPRYWLFGVAAVVIFLIANGEVHRSYGNFSFVRLQQGKGILVSVLVPLLITYGLRFGLQPTARNWLLLTGVQITAIGVTPTALMVAPSVASLAVFAGAVGVEIVPLLKRLLFGLAASGYVVSIGLFIKLSEMLRPYEVNLPSTEFLDVNRELVFGNGRFLYFSLFVVLTAWFWAETPVARRFSLVFPLGIGLFFANPLAAQVLAEYFTENVYWRVFWILPLPALAGLTLLAPLSFQKFQISAPVRYTLYILLLVFLLIVISEQTIFSAKNRVTLGMPGLKVSPEYQVAQAINDAFKDRPDVLLPESVSVWLATMHQHPYPVLSRLMHAYQFGEDGHTRYSLKGYVMGVERPENAPEFFRAGLEKYRVQGVCIPPWNQWADEIRAVLQESGFETYQTVLAYEIWIKRPRS